MNSDCTALLSELLHDGGEFAARVHHEVGKFIHDAHDVTHLFNAVHTDILGLDPFVVGLDVAEASLGENRVTAFHFGHEPVESVDAIVRIHEDLAVDDVRNVLVVVQFDTLGIDKHQVEIVELHVAEQGTDDGVDAHGLARAGLTSYEQVGSLSQVDSTGFASYGHTDFERKFHAVLVRSVDIAGKDSLAVCCGNVQGEIALLGNGSEGHACDLELQSEVIGEVGNGLDAYATRKDEVYTSHDRAALDGVCTDASHAEACDCVHYAVAQFGIHATAEVGSFAERLPFGDIAVAPSVETLERNLVAIVKVSRCKHFKNFGVHGKSSLVNGNITLI